MDRWAHEPPRGRSLTASPHVLSHNHGSTPPEKPVSRASERSTIVAGWRRLPVYSDDAGTVSGNLRENLMRTVVAAALWALMMASTAHAAIREEPVTYQDGNI